MSEDWRVTDDVIISALARKLEEPGFDSVLLLIRQIETNAYERGRISVQNPIKEALGIPLWTHAGWHAPRS